MKDIRIAKLPSRFHKDESKRKHPKIDGYKNINVCSSSPHHWRTLSPMLLGPIYIVLDKDDNVIQFSVDELKGDNIKKCSNLENFWQSLKVFKSEYVNDKITKEWYKTRDSMWKTTKGIRRKELAKKEKCLFSSFANKQLSYLEARQDIYCPLYHKLVVKTQSYNKLKDLLKTTNVQLLDYDGYDVKGKDIQECYLDDSRPFGHSLVLKCVLEDNFLWEDLLIL